METQRIIYQFSFLGNMIKGFLWVYHSLLRDEIFMIPSIFMWEIVITKKEYNDTNIAGNKSSAFHQSIRPTDSIHLQRDWFSGKILRCHPQRRGALGSIPRSRISFCTFTLSCRGNASSFSQLAFCIYARTKCVVVTAIAQSAVQVLRRSFAYYS